MANTSLKTSTIKTFEKYNSMLVGNEFYIPLSADALVVAGGGGGGPASGFSGGGGAGGYRIFTGLNVSAGTSYTLTVGAGGAQNSAGSNSVFDTYTSAGGGTSGGNGGSGGGNGGLGNTPATSPSQGNNGGTGQTAEAGAGGGGANAVGSNPAAFNIGGGGGSGVSSSITGTAVVRAGGGGGSGGNSGGGGGSGGGGNGARVGAEGTAGIANTGGGGGGGLSYLGSTFRSGQPGGSGIVILRYPKNFTLTVGAGLTASTTIDGLSKVTQFTAGTGSVSW